VFLIKDLGLEMILPAISEKYETRIPIWMIFFKCGFTASAVGGWAYFLAIDGQVSGEDYIDLMYVVLFVGINVL